MHTPDRRPTRALKVAALVILVLFLGALSITAARWPFTRERALRGLARTTHCNVQTAEFHMTFLPRPGCTLEYPVFLRGTGITIATADALHLRTSWANILTSQHRLTELRALGLRIRIPLPAPPAPPQERGGSENVVGELIADGAIIEFVPTRTNRPVKFTAHKLTLTEVAPSTRIGVSTTLDLPHPPGRLTASGTLGPVGTGSLETIPASGRYELASADLARYKPLQGTLVAKGDFQGILGKLNVRGDAAVSGFALNGTKSGVHLQTTYAAVVNGPKGDVVLNTVKTHFLGTHLETSGSIQSNPKGPGKTVDLKFAGHHARIEDFSQVITREGAAPLAGPMILTSRVHFLSKDRPFLQHLNLAGSFRINDATWTKAATQTKVDDLSARARGEKEQAEKGEVADRVVTDLSGVVDIHQGTAHLSKLAFRIPGAAAAGGGTYQLLTKQIDLHGKVTLQADLSEAVSGLKSLLLKPFNFVFRRNGDNHGATLHFSITGTLHQPRYRVGLTKK